MEYSSKQSQEKRRGFIDPRTKLALILILALFVMGGLGGGQMQPLKMILSALPFALLLAEKQWTRFFRGVCMLVCGYALLWVMPYLPAVLSYFALLCGGILTRGLGAPVKRTNICRIGFRAQDYLLLAGCLFVVCSWILELCGVRLW